MTVAEWKQQMEDLIRSLPDWAYGTLELERNDVGNLSVLSQDGEWLGFIDVLHPEHSQPPYAVA